MFDPISIVHQAVHSEVMANRLHTLQDAFVVGLGPRITSGLTPVRDYFCEVERSLSDGLLMTDDFDSRECRDRFVEGEMPSEGECVVLQTQGESSTLEVTTASGY